MIIAGGWCGAKVSVKRAGKVGVINGSRPGPGFWGLGGVRVEAGGALWGEIYASSGLCNTTAMAWGSSALILKNLFAEEFVCIKIEENYFLIEIVLLCRLCEGLALKSEDCLADCS
jgi:hypothetical protein